MMDYFYMNINSISPVQPVIADIEKYPYKVTKEAFEKMSDNYIGYYILKENYEIPEILNHPTFMVQSELRRVISLYDDGIQWKNVTLLPDDLSAAKERAEVYHVPFLKKIDCIHKDSIIYDNGSIEKLVLESAKLQPLDIFQIDNLLANKIVVSLRMAESIMRRNCYGIRFEKVVVH